MMMMDDDDGGGDNDDGHDASSMMVVMMMMVMMVAMVLGNAALGLSLVKLLETIMLTESIQFNYATQCYSFHDKRFLVSINLPTKAKFEGVGPLSAVETIKATISNLLKLLPLFTGFHNLLLKINPY